jgi:hypothetical protein
VASPDVLLSFAAASLFGAGSALTGLSALAGLLSLAIVFPKATLI